MLTMALRHFAAVFFLLGTPAHAAAPDAFLDQPVHRDLIPSSSDGNILQFDSYAARMEHLRAVLPCPVIFPDGLDAFVREKDIGTDWSKGKTFFLSERNGMGFPLGSTFRDLVDNSTQNLHLRWNYDPAQKAIVTDFPWHIQDDRSGALLLAYLGSNQPSPYIRSRPANGRPSPNDLWLTAFDALLSRPENFSRVWPLRFAADDRMFFGAPSDNTIVAGKITDANGSTHFLIVNSQEEMMNPGPPGSISYYLFDPQGRFESGGIQTVGYRCFDDSAWLDGDGRRLWVETWNNGSMKRDLIFDVEKGQLTLKDFLVDGQEPAKAWPWAGIDAGQSIFTVSP
jgi:hypothetical protein